MVADGDEVFSLQGGATNQAAIDIRLREKLRGVLGIAAAAIEDANLIGSGLIESISFNAVGSITRNLEIYLINTEKTSFTGASDWITATAENLVYSGNVAMVANDWTTITFDNPFMFDGTNLAVVVNDLTGSWTSSISYNAFSAPSQAIRIYQDSAPYSPSNPGTGSSRIRGPWHPRWGTGCRRNGPPSPSV